ncbi:MAG: hypothetical protein PHO41_05000 [Eubacteriales bacterium]|nr:hypothetical protein [Eubacteriales bacterium]
MQLFVLITNEVDSINPLLSTLMQKGVTGATVVDCKGMLTSLSQSSVDAPPIFGSLRRFIDPERESGKMLFVVLRDEQLSIVRGAVHKQLGDLDRPNRGVMFTIPVMSVEGVKND